MRAFIKFNQGIMKMPVHWQLWLMVLITFNLVIPLFLLSHVEAQVVLGVLVASLMLFTVLTARFGFTRLLGLGHILWFPLIYFLWTRLEQSPPDDVFGIWIRVLIALNTASLVIDAVDVVRYIAGDREATVKGLS